MKKPYLIFCGTTTSLIYALDADKAFVNWNEGRMFGIDRSEVNVRELTAADEPWILDSGSSSMLEAVRKL